MNKNNNELPAGEKELRIDFERATTKNILTMVAHGNDTRKMFRELEEQVKRLTNEMLVQKKVIGELRKQLSILQQRFYAKGTTSYGDNT